LRAELKTLYAAVLRTFCLNAEAIRALCQWESLRRPHAASSGFASRAHSTSVVDGSVDASVDGSLRTVAEAAPFSPVSAPGVPASPHGGSRHWGALAGGACALGGAAILAWIAVGHLTQRDTIGEVKTAGKFPVRQEAQLANHHSPDAAATPYATDNDRAAAHEVLPNALATAPLRDLTTSPASEIVTPVKAAPARATTGKNVSRRGDRQPESAAIQHERRGRNSRTAITENLSPQLPSQLPHASPMNYEGSQIAVSANAHRTSPRPSSAGPYSPLAPSQLGTDEYASMTLSAGTHLRNIAPPSRPAASVNSPGISGTEWINHMSQRRVTEDPDQFAN
jgi:hypothetical protein